MYAILLAFLNLMIAASLFPIASYAKDRDYYRYLPSTEEVYNDCKKAVAHADKGDLKAFYDSRCAARANAVFTTLFYALHYIPVISEDASEQQKHDMDVEIKTLKSISARFCGLKALSERPSEEPPEITFARDFIAAIDANRTAKGFESFFHKRNPFVLNQAFSYNCKPDTKS